MNNFQLTEWAVLSVIIGLQIAFFFWTTRSLLILRDIFPGKEDISVAQSADLSLLSTVHKNGVFTTIVDSVNMYLLKNKGAAADFYLIKDISERNCEALEDGISQSANVPLYLGLMGTFLGILIGLSKFSIVGLSAQTDQMDNALSFLLNGVKTAMIASFSGLLLTVIINALSFRAAKATLERKKNIFYTFIQTELLPVLNQNISSTLYVLQTNLQAFNKAFSNNVGKLDDVMGHNHEVAQVQQEIFKSIENTDFPSIAKANITILRQLNITTEKLTGFNDYLSSLNSLAENSRTLVRELDGILSRTAKTEALANNLIEIFQQNKALTEFLQNHYSALDESRQQIILGVSRVGSTIQETLDELKMFTQQKIQEIQKITLREIDAMSTHYPDKWQKLDQLDQLQKLDQLSSQLTKLDHLEKLNMLEKLDGLDKLDQLIQKLDQLKPAPAADTADLTGELKETNQLLRSLIGQFQQRKDRPGWWKRFIHWGFNPKTK